MEGKRVEERRHYKRKVYSQNGKFTLSPTLVKEENLRVFIMRNTYSTWQVKQEIDDASRRRRRRSLGFRFGFGKWSIDEIYLFWTKCSNIFMHCFGLHLYIYTCSNSVLELMRLFEMMLQKVALFQIVASVTEDCRVSESCYSSTKIHTVSVNQCIVFEKYWIIFS